MIITLIIIIIIIILVTIIRTRETVLVQLDLWRSHAVCPRFGGRKGNCQVAMKIVMALVAMMAIMTMMIAMNAMMMMIVMIAIPDSSEEDSAEYTSLTMFLAAIGLHDWAPKVRSPPSPPSVITIITAITITKGAVITIKREIPKKFHLTSHRQNRDNAHASDIKMI